MEQRAEKFSRLGAGWMIAWRGVKGWIASLRSQ
jgi:hypothetical protein